MFWPELSSQKTCAILYLSVRLKCTIWKRNKSQLASHYSNDTGELFNLKTWLVRIVGGGRRGGRICYVIIDQIEPWPCQWNVESIPHVNQYNMIYIRTLEKCRPWGLSGPLGLCLRMKWPRYQKWEMFHQKTDPAKTSDLRQNRDVREILLPQQQKYQLQ